MQLNTGNFLSKQPVNLAQSQETRPKTGKVTVSYQEPVTESVELGHIPKPSRHNNAIESGQDYVHKYTAGRSPKNGLDQNWKAVWKEQPVVEDGQPVFESAEKTFHLGPVSKKEWFVKFGLAGALMGAALGAVAVGFAAAGTITCAPLVIAGSAAAIGLTTGALGASAASDKSVELEWVKTPIESEKLVGYKHTAHTDNTGDGPSRTYHSYSPVTESQELGTWMKPVAVITSPGSPGPREAPAWHDAIK